jgi:hypothetical protein
MGDQNFQLRYSASEDRVLIMSGTGDADMRCFALTRRMVQQLWPGMNRVMTMVRPSASGPKAPATGQAAAPQSAPQPQPAVSDAHHLVRKLQLVDQGSKSRLLVLTAEDAVLRVSLDELQLAQIYDALRTVIRRADWGIDLDEGLPGAATAGQQPGEPDIDITADSPSRYRH